VVWRRELGVVAVNWTDILDGEIVNAAWAVAGMVAKPRASRRTAADLDTAGWADTERLITEALTEIAPERELPDLSAGEAAELEAAVRTPEVQGALQALLAARLTDAPETDAALAREAVRLAFTESALASPHPSDRRRKATISAASALAPLPEFEAAGRKYAVVLSEYFDGKISALVARLEGQVGFAGLAQVRAEAYNARIVALLGAIERQVAALADPTRGTRAEAEFVERYRRQAHQRHGFLTPPDFDRRRRVPVADIYVPTTISAEDGAERVRHSPDTGPRSLKVWDLAGRLDRTVLLGDPGGGKTTAANVLTDRFAADGNPLVAFLVTLREYAAKTPIEWSVAEHIEHNLNTLYQSPAPDGLVERLLLTGRAVLIFDGLDELLDTSRRCDVSDRVEQFCSAYPLTPVLVTSRAVGYDQARLDDTQFTCYRLGGFGDEEVTEYAGKWFRTQEGLAPAEAAAKAQAFIEESAHAADLRGNPLLMSLMCILYRGAGSLPGDRAGIYARCAELLLRKWDEQRDLYRKLGSDHLVEPTLRYLAWWLFTRQDSQTAATERELTGKAAEFLYERGYETQEQARTAAREFVEFCRGRMWVFSDAGTTADGEKLYGFTHRTFLEYFTAWHLVVTSESPEDLARMLAPRIAAGEWTTVAALAMKIKSQASDRGADRVYAVLLDPGLAASHAGPLLEFLATFLPSARPSPAAVRKLTRAVLDDVMRSAPAVQLRFGPMAKLLACGLDYRDPIGEEISGRIADLVASDAARHRADGLWLVSSLPFRSDGSDEFWTNWARDQCRHYAAEVASAAVDNKELRILALAARTLTVRDAIAMPGGLTILTTVPALFLTSQGDSGPVKVPYLFFMAQTLMYLPQDQEMASNITATGNHLIAHPELPWVRGPLTADDNMLTPFYAMWDTAEEFPVIEEEGNLGAAAIVCIIAELNGNSINLPRMTDLESGHSPAGMSPLTLYMASRFNGETGELPDLPVPTDFRQVFRDWAACRINFTEATRKAVKSRKARTRSG
jgi:hypothetical protein